MFIARLLNNGTNGSWSWILCYGSCPMLGRKFSRISSLCPPDASSTDVTSKQKYLQTLPNVLWGAKAPTVKYYLVETYDSALLHISSQLLGPWS